MVEVYNSEFGEIKKVECRSIIKGYFYDDIPVFRIITWTDQFETTMCNGEKDIFLGLTDKIESIEMGVFYLANTENEKERIYNALSKFIEEIDGQEINPADYNNDDLNKTKFPVIEGIKRRWDSICK